MNWSYIQSDKVIFGNVHLLLLISPTDSFPGFLEVVAFR
jgi:hypothetical protein